MRPLQCLETHGTDHQPSNATSYPRTMAMLTTRLCKPKNTAGVC